MTYSGSNNWANYFAAPSFQVTAPIFTTTASTFINFNSALQGGELMLPTINVPPAKGKTAAQAARELRVLLKQLYSETLTPIVPAPLPGKNEGPLRGLGKIDQMVASLEGNLNQLEQDLAELVEISKKRR